MRIVAFSGKAQAGKTTSALHAISVFGGTKIALGDAVKEEVGAFINSCGLAYEERHLYGTAADREEEVATNLEMMVTMPQPLQHLTTQTCFTYRQLLQSWGTEYRRAQSEMYWTDRGREKILKTEGLVFNDDLRFPDEVKMIQDLGGIVIRLERPGGARIKETYHPSETALDGFWLFDVTVINGGSVEDLQESIEKVLRWVL